MKINSPKLIFLLTCTFLLSSTLVKAEKTPPSGTLTMEIKEVAIGVGGQSGSGTLNFQGNEYHFKIKGLEIGSFGKVHLKGSGKIYHLDTINEFEGMYFQAKASITLGENEKSGVFLINSHGVTIYISNENEGVDLTLGRGGIKIKFDRETKKKIKEAKNSTHSK